MSCRSRELDIEGGHAADIVAQLAHDLVAERLRALRALSRTSTSPLSAVATGRALSLFSSLKRCPLACLGDYLLDLFKKPICLLHAVPAASVIYDENAPLGHRR